MKLKTIVSIIFLLAIIGGIYYISNSSVGKITGTQARELISEDPTTVLIDVRTPEEYSVSHLPNSILIPHDVIGQKISTYVPNKDTKIILYCRSGNRSGQAAATLKQLGYTNIYDLGAMTNWNS